MDARSIADIPEAELASILFGDHPARPFLLGAAGVGPSAEVLLTVPSSALGETVANTAPGDIDAIVFPSGVPEQATAFEIKRVKVQPHTFSTGTPGKLGELQKAARQANGLANTGFHNVVLAILVVTDGRGRDEFNFAFRGASVDLLVAIDSALPLEDIAAAVSVFRFELTQPVDRDFTLSGGVTAKALRLTAPQTQSPHLTAQIRRYAAALT